jgi:predicted metal-dependent hydrolase
VSIERHRIEISGIQVEIVRKDIKNLHLGVYPPNGRVRAAVPLRLGDEAVRLALVSRLGWIKRQRLAFLDQDRQSEREMVTGETHYVEGRRCRLKLVLHDGPAQVELRNNRALVLRVRPQLDTEERLAVLERWYRARLREQARDLVAHWAARLNVSVSDWGIKKMRTRWGTCNQDARRIWLNLELAKKPSQCVEYIVVHELVHIIERHHNDRFAGLMDQYLPDWRLRRDFLNKSPLAHEEWAY